MTSPTKNEVQNFLIFSLQSRQLAASLKGLNSSLAQSPGELWHCEVAGK